jgi:hypothetical protein
MDKVRPVEADAAAAMEAGKAVGGKGGGGGRSPDSAGEGWAAERSTQRRDEVFFANSTRSMHTSGSSLGVTWRKFAGEECPNIFKATGVHLSTDGGLSDVADLMYPLQYLYAVLLVAFCVSNVYMVTYTDLKVILADSGSDLLSATKEWLIGKELIHQIGSLGGRVELQVPLEKVIFVVELLVMYALLLRIMCCLCISIFANTLSRCAERVGLTPRSDEDSDYARWSSIANVCWHYLPGLSTFSAMRLLYFVTPSVAGTQGYVVFFLVKEEFAQSTACLQRAKALLPMLWFLVSRAFALVVGVDAFVIKLRMAQEYVKGDHLEAEAAFSLIIFLFQILGVVNLNWFVRERLLIFIFGGEDGNVDQEEKARWHVWKALVTKRVYSIHGIFKGTIVMLGFDDYDFQMLVLDDHKTLEKVSKKVSETGQLHDIDIYHPTGIQSILNAGRSEEGEVPSRQQLEEGCVLSL